MVVPHWTVGIPVVLKFGLFLLSAQIVMMPLSFSDYFIVTNLR